MPDGITTLGRYAFNSCTSLETINLPNSITVMGMNCFSGCSSLKSVTLPSGIYYVSSECFSDCRNLVSVNFPANGNLYKLSSSCFSGCTSLASVTLPGNIKDLDIRCFMNCKSLKQVILSEGTTGLGLGCFTNCTSLESITFPESINGIGMYCFDGCTSLFSVTCPWENIDTVSVSGDAFRGIFSEAILNVPKGTEEMYKAVEPWKSFNRFAVYDKTGTGVGLSDILADEFGVELSNGGQTVAVSGLANGAKVSLYTTDGMLLSTDNASDSGTAMLDTKNEHGVLILKIGSKGHKIIVN